LQKNNLGKYLTGKIIMKRSLMTFFVEKDNVIHSRGNQLQHERCENQHLKKEQTKDL